MRGLFARGPAVVALAGLLLIPLGGVAGSAPTRHGSTGTCAHRGAAGLAVARSVPFGSGCFQDQYGDTFAMVSDTRHHYITGTETVGSAQCQYDSWPILGSYVDSGGRTTYEFTIVNPAGTGDPGCVDAAKLKGVWPKGSWYYDGGFGGQGFSWTSCGGPAANVSGPGRGVGR